MDRHNSRYSAQHSLHRYSNPNHHHHSQHHEQGSETYSDRYRDRSYVENRRSSYDSRHVPSKSKEQVDADYHRVLVPVAEEETEDELEKVLQGAPNNTEKRGACWEVN